TKRRRSAHPPQKPPRSRARDTPRRAKSPRCPPSRPRYAAGKSPCLCERCTLCDTPGSYPAAPAAHGCLYCPDPFGLWRDTPDWGSMSLWGPCRCSSLGFAGKHAKKKYLWTPIVVTSTPHHGCVESYRARERSTALPWGSRTAFFNVTYTFAVIASPGSNLQFLLDA